VSTTAPQIATLNEKPPRTPGAGTLNEEQPRAPHIGTLNEKPLHAALKDAYAQPGDELEAPVDGYCIDLVRGELLVEFQTTGFTPIRRKLETLAGDHPVRLVHPIAAATWLVKQDGQGREVSRRKSPKRGCIDDVFEVLVGAPKLLASENFSLEVVMIHEEQVRRHSPRARRRGGWVTHERRLLDIVDRWVFETPAHLADLLPNGLADEFTTADLAARMHKPRWLTQKMAYCLRECGAITAVGKQGRAVLYRLACAPHATKDD